MNILLSIKGLLSALLIKMFPSLGYRGAVNTQITIYNRLRAKFPNAAENDLLNSLIMSRIKSFPAMTSTEKEHIHYRPLLQNPNKKLYDVIWAIIEYENILSREDDIQAQFVRMELPQTLVAVEMDSQKEIWKTYIKESIEKNADLLG
jgi:hypothetical protein